MKMIHPTPIGYMMGHYFIVIPLSALVVFAGVQLSSVKDFSQFWLWVVAAGVAIFAIPFIHSVFYSKTTSMGFDEDKIVFESGILSRRTKKAPVHMITDSSLTRTLLQRICGTATLNISTSGSTGYEMVCEGLKNSEAKMLHEQIYERIEQERKKS